MAYRTLYREWRPAVFADVLGQNAVVKTLKRQIVTGRIAHAYLFCGSKGTGKTSLAKILSRAINCQQPDQGEPCGVCEVCRAILSESTLDVLELDAASNNSVDNVRELLEQVRYPAQVGKYKVYIIDEVHMLSTAAFNALLKTLEEPPEHVVFILATTEPQRIPATILSRVQRFDISRIPAPLIQGRMEEALRRLQITAEPEALQMIARAAEGAMRDAWSILDMAVSSAVEDTITTEIVRDILGAADKETLFRFADVLAQRSTRGVMEEIDHLIRAGHEAQVFLREMTRHLRSLLIVKVMDHGAAALLQITQEDEKRYRTQADQFSQERLTRMVGGLMAADSELRFASSPRIGLEVDMLQACEDQAGETMTALNERVSELELKLRQLPDASAVAVWRNAASKSAESGSVLAESDTGKIAQTPIAHENENHKPSVSNSEPAAAQHNEALQDTEIWKAVLKQLAVSEPATFGLLKRERFLGEQDGVFRVQVPQERKNFSYASLRRQEKIDAISQALTAAGNRPLRFEAVLEGEAAVRPSGVQENIQMLADMVGRDLLQIDDSEE